MSGGPSVLPEGRGKPAAQFPFLLACGIGFAAWAGFTLCFIGVYTVLGWLT